MDKYKTAFPYVFTNLNGDTEMETGMTLRDYFASSAMQGIIASTRGIGLEINEKHIETIAKKAYMYADTMLERRKK